MILVQFEENGPHLEPGSVIQDDLFRLWQEDRDCRGRSNPITNIVRGIPNMP